MKLWMAWLIVFVPMAAHAEMVPTEAIVMEQEEGDFRRGGSSTGVGTDTYDLRTQTAWFYGNQPIVTCFNSLADFSESPAQLRKVLEKSIERWRAYFKAKNIVGQASAQTPNLNFKLTGKCKRDEDLVFHFGTGPIFANMLDLKTAQTLSSPLAYANKMMMNREMTWAKGYVRIVADGYYNGEGEEPFPNWRKPGALEAILVHEIGHILGFTHTPNTVMSAEFVQRQLTESTKRVDVKIDGEKQLVTCTTCKETRKLRAPETGDISFFTKLGLDKRRPVSLSKEGAVFELTDGKIRKPLADVKESKVESAQTLLTNFPAALNDRTVTSNFYARVESEGKKIPVMIEYNSSAHQGDLVLRAVIDDELKTVGVFVRE